MEPDYVLHVLGLRCFSLVLCLYVSSCIQLEDQNENHRVLEEVSKRDVNICVFF